MKNATKKAKAGRDVDFKEVRAKESESGGRGSGGELEAKANRRCRGAAAAKHAPSSGADGGEGGKTSLHRFPTARQRWRQQAGAGLPPSSAVLRGKCSSCCSSVEKSCKVKKSSVEWTSIVEA